MDSLLISAPAWGWPVPHFAPRCQVPKINSVERCSSGSVANNIGQPLLRRLPSPSLLWTRRGPLQDDARVQSSGKFQLSTWSSPARYGSGIGAFDPARPRQRAGRDGLRVLIEVQGHRGQHEPGADAVLWAEGAEDV